MECGEPRRRAFVPTDPRRNRVSESLTLPLHNRLSDRIITMLLTCPSCETSFRVKPEALGPSGRTVRCARCHTNWFAAPEGVEREPAMAEVPTIEAVSTSLPIIPSNDPVNHAVSWREPSEENETAPRCWDCA